MISKGFWWAESQWNLLWNPNSPWYFKRHFASHSPIKIRSNLTFPQEIQWDFDGQKANEICPGIHFSLSISKGICICFGIFDIIYFFKLYLFCSAKVQNAKQSAKQCKDISNRWIILFLFQIHFVLQCKSAKRKKKCKKDFKKSKISPADE